MSEVPIKKWIEKEYSFPPGATVVNLDPETNIVKFINEDMTGFPLYASTKMGASPSMFEIKTDIGSSNSIVRTRAIGSLYVFNPGNKNIQLTVIEIYTEDISFIFNATNQVNISGALQSNGLKATDLKRTGDQTLFVTDALTQTKLDEVVTQLKLLVAKP